jgi:hypothetical protein
MLESYLGRDPALATDEVVLDITQTAITSEPGSGVRFHTGIDLVVLIRKRIAQRLLRATGTHRSLSLPVYP